MSPDRCAGRTEQQQVVDALKENHYLRARIEEATAQKQAVDRRQLQELRSE